MTRQIVMTLFLAGTSVFAQAPPPLDANVVLQVSVAGEPRPFRIGEAIQLQLGFSSAVANRYEIEMGGPMVEHFAVTPVGGSIDPEASSRQMSGSWISGFRYLSPEPATIQLTLNEWVRFTRPGEYRVEVTSERVQRKDTSSAGGRSPVIVAGNSITLTIVAATADWQKATFDRAIATLDLSPPTPASDRYYQSRSAAFDTLRFLGTPDAIRELAARLGNETIGNGNAICSHGLITAPDHAIARAALEEALVDPDRAIDQLFLDTLTAVRSPNLAFSAGERRRAVESLVAALPKKQGRAYGVSLDTAVNEVWNGAALPAATADSLVVQLIATFDQLPVQQQRGLLTSRWDRIAGPAMVPLLRRLVVADTALDPGTPDGSAERDLGTNALQHWYELDPAGARPAIIAEIERPHPRYDARVLGMLPDRTLPEADAGFAEHLAAADSFDELSNLASLIARYATRSMLAPVLTTLDARLGRWSCAIQDPLLAYVLRVDPVLATPRIEQALASRGPTQSSCFREMLPAIAALTNAPLLEDLAIRGLDDPDPDVIGSSAKMLGEFGSPRAEAVLLAHFTRWSEQWTDHEADLNLTFSDQGPQRAALVQGSSLLQALITGQSWMTDPEKLQRLLPLARGERLHQTIEDAQRPWSRTPLDIALQYFSGSSFFYAIIAQYDLRSLTALHDKLAQFPAGTRVALHVMGPDTPTRHASDDALRAFLVAHQFVVIEK